MKIFLLVLAVAISASVHCSPIQTVNESSDDLVTLAAKEAFPDLTDKDIQELLADLAAPIYLPDSTKNEIQEGSAANNLPYWFGGWWIPDPISSTLTTVAVIGTIFGSLQPGPYRPDKPAPHKVKPRKPKITTTTTTTPKPTTSTTTEPPPPPKPKVWVAVNDPASFEDAQRHCSITGAHLATPETPVEIRKIETIMAHVDKKSCTGEVWVGLRQVVETGNFTWVTGLPLGRFTYWTPEVAAEEGSCISQSLTNGTDVEWHKRTCSLNLCYICEFLL